MSRFYASSFAASAIARSLLPIAYAFFTFVIASSPRQEGLFDLLGDRVAGLVAAFLLRLSVKR